MLFMAGVFKSGKMDKAIKVNLLKIRRMDLEDGLPVTIWDTKDSLRTAKDLDSESLLSLLDIDTQDNGLTTKSTDKDSNIKLMEIHIKEIFKKTSIKDLVFRKLNQTVMCIQVIFLQI